MLSFNKLRELCRQQRMDAEQLASQITRAGLDENEAITAVNNWQKGLFKPIPSSEDIRRLAAALSVDVNDLVAWRSSYRFAPISAHKSVRVP